MTNSSDVTLCRAVLISVSLITGSAFADTTGDYAHKLATPIQHDQVQLLLLADGQTQSRRSRREPYHGYERYERESNRYRSDWQDRINRREYEPRQDYRFASYTSPPLRGGSSRRTRIIENPHADRLVTGITLRGIGQDMVHIRDVVAYPGRYVVSTQGYSLSQYFSPKFIKTRDYIDYISVAAKRKQYFTVTFHYD